MLKRLKKVEEQLDDIHGVLFFGEENDCKRMTDILEKYKNIVNHGDPSDKTGDKYINYVNGMDAAFETGMRDKIEHIISELKNELMKFPLKHDEQVFYRAAIHFGYILLDYADDIKRRKTSFMEDSDSDIFNSNEE